MTKNLSSTFLSHHLFSNFDEIILISKMLKKIKGLFENLFFRNNFLFIICPERWIITSHSWHSGIYFKGNLSKIMNRWLRFSY